MKKVTNSTFGMMVEIRKERSKRTVMLQYVKKDGNWSKPFEAQVYGNESPEMVVERMVRNNNRQYRLAQ